MSAMHTGKFMERLILDRSLITAEHVIGGLESHPVDLIDTMRGVLPA